MTKKITVVTGNRAEYGLLAPLMHEIAASHDLQLQLVVTGAHLLEAFGNTVTDIENDGFIVDATVPELGSASSGQDVASQVGLGTVAFTATFGTLSPDVVVLLGDRYELLAAGIAAFFSNIPILHIHGGEVTNGAFDDAIRHSLSKFARVHAVAAPEYRDRLILQGEQPDSIFVVGGLGADLLSTSRKLTRKQVEARLGVELRMPLFVVTYHPVTVAAHNTSQEVSNLIEALSAFPNATVIFTSPNSDPEHELIVEGLKDAVLEHESWSFHASLGTEVYHSLLAFATAVIGNSSSGLTEAPSLSVPTVNIGPRQDGRLTAHSVISCGTAPNEIKDSIARALSPEFHRQLTDVQNPYGGVGAVSQIVELLETTPFDTLEPKKYFDAGLASKG